MCVRQKIDLNLISNIYKYLIKHIYLNKRSISFFILLLTFKKILYRDEIYCEMYKRFVFFFLDLHYHFFQKQRLLDYILQENTISYCIL